MNLEINIEIFPTCFPFFKRLSKKESDLLCLREQNTTRKNENRDPPQRLGRQPAKRQSVGRRASDSTGQTLKVGQPRERIRSAPPCPLFDRVKIQNDSRLTEATKQLSDEELALLYEDILKPLDCYAMLHEKRKKL